MFDGLRYICFLTTLQTQVEVQGDYGDYSERALCATSEKSCDAAHDFEFGVKNPMGRRRSVNDLSLLFFFFLRAARHPADSDGLSNRRFPGTGQGTKGTMASVPLWASTALQSAVSL